MKHKYKVAPVLAALAVAFAMVFGVGVAVGASTAPTRDESQAAVDTLQRLVDAHYSPTPTPSATATASPSPTASGRPSGLAWSSGVGPGAQAGFAAGRGRAVDNVSVFPSRGSWADRNGLLDPWWQAAVPAADRGRVDLVVGLPLWPQSNSLGNTGTDAQWRALADQIEQVDANAYVRLGWEMNIPSAYWALTNANAFAWTDEFRRIVIQMKTAAPALRFVWNPNNGADQSCNACSRPAFQRVKAHIYAYGIDSYDAYPPVTSNVNEQYHLTAFGKLGESYQYALDNDVKFALPEWGVSSGTSWAGNTGGDNPRYMNLYVGFVKARAVNVAFDSYFNEAASYVRSELFTSTHPLASQAYKAGLS